MATKPSFEVLAILEKIVAVREKLILSGCSKKQDSMSKMKTLRSFCERYRGFDDRITGGWLVDNYNLVLQVMPGESSRCHLPLLIELNRQLKNYMRTRTNNPIRCYLAGPITDMPELNLTEFRAVEAILREQFDYKVTVPHDLFEGIDTSGFSHQDYMDVCLPEIGKHDVILFLPGWKESKGSVMEMEEAVKTSRMIKFAEIELKKHLYAKP
jgi:hypothetical protein